MTHLLTPEQLAFFKTLGFIEVNLSESLRDTITRERCSLLAKRICDHVNRLVAERGGPSDGISPTTPVSKSFYTVEKRKTDLR